MKKKFALLLVSVMAVGERKYRSKRGYRSRNT